MVKSASVETAVESVQRPTAERVIDLVHLAKQTLGDRGLELEVLRIYDQVAHGYLDSLRTTRSPDAIKLNLHSLKGASAGIGANGIATMARAAEQEFAKSGSVNEETISDIGIALEEVSTYIAELIKS